MVGARREDAFRMPGSERFSRSRCAGLVEQRRALRRRLAQVIAGNVEVFPLVTDLMHLLGIGEDALLAVADDGALLPAALEQLVEDFDIFLGHLIPVVVATQPALTDILGAALEIGGDDVPADAAFGMDDRRSKGVAQMYKDARTKSKR